MRATLTLKPAGEFQDMHKTLIVAADFASAARGWHARWKILLDADVIHNDFGQGRVTLVADRGGASPLLTICFLKGGLKQFNPDSFALGGFQSISLSSQKAEFVSEWLDEVNRVTAALEQERKISEEKAQTRSLRAAEVKGIVEEFSITVAQAQRSELASVLMRIKAGDQLDSKELSWLNEEGMFGVLAAYFEDRYDQHQKLWSLVKACSNLRKVQKATPTVCLARSTTGSENPLLATTISCRQRSSAVVQKPAIASERLRSGNRLRLYSRKLRCIYTVKILRRMAGRLGTCRKKARRLG